MSAVNASPAPTTVAATKIAICPTMDRDPI
jgi:hypothetical protein